MNISTSREYRQHYLRHRIKVALIGSRGIPPRYGGTETFVYELSKRLKENFDIYVTCEDNGFYMDEYEGIKRIHIWAKHTPTMTLPVIYDIIATLYLLRKVPDIDLLFYVAPDGAYAAILAKLAGKRTVVSTDGVEWQRLLTRIKYAPLSHRPMYLLAMFALFLAEFFACKIPDATIADAITIKHHIERRWKPKKAVYIAYGVRQLPQIDEEKQKIILHKLGLEKHGYYLTVGRIVAENNIHMEIQAFTQAKTRKKLVIVGPIKPKRPLRETSLQTQKRRPTHNLHRSNIRHRNPLHTTCQLQSLYSRLHSRRHQPLPTGATTVQPPHPRLRRSLPP
jgi:rhamnosyltransferase